MVADSQAKLEFGGFYRASAKVKFDLARIKLTLPASTSHGKSTAIRTY